MKKLFIIIILILSPCWWILSQTTDSISVAERISTMELSKSDLISRGRRLILKELDTNNVDGVKEIMNYLIENVEDENHQAFWATERLMLYYWIGDYSKILDLALYLNSEQAEKQSAPSFSPSDDLIGEKVSSLIKNEYDLIEKDIKSLKYSKDTEEFLPLFLDRLLVVYDSESLSIDEINETSDLFIKQYPDSPLSKVVKEVVSYRFEPADFQWGMTIGGGAYFTSGNVSEYIDFYPAFFNVSLDAFYKKMYFGLYLTASGSDVKKDIQIKNKNQVWPAGENLPLALIAPCIGFNALEYKRAKLVPFAGVSFNFAQPSQNAIDDNPDLENLSLGTSVTPLFGFNLDFALNDMKKIKPQHYGEPSNCSYLGLQAMYMPNIFTTQESRLTGGVFMLGLTFKFFFFQLKRIY